ncbi:MAG: pimeloyl-ACP methyl ester carboxylesterase [Alphaproteobacteria bacterium]|jgi:pimeloyl-ACP methyl ester carboxylesterase
MPDEILTIDRKVEHVSSVPAIAGQMMAQFVREKVPATIARSITGHAPEGKVVLMVHGGFWPSSVAFDCPHPDMSWMDALAREGFDVFTLDMTGHGRSALPLQDDPLNLSLEDRAKLPAGTLAPALMDAPAPYPYRLATTDSETADLDAVVDFIRDLRGVDRVHLIGWSGGGIRTGTYAGRYPDKVARLIIWASSNYLPDGPDGPPPTVPAPGYPMAFQTRAHGEHIRWRANIRCDGQVEDDSIFDAVWRAGAEADPLGATWGGLRGPNRTYWGWTARAAAQLKLPALVIVGECDRLIASNIGLYSDLGSDHKAFLQIAYASHFMMWERARVVQRRAALEWLSHGTFNGACTGTFRADAAGQIQAQEPTLPGPEMAGA